jgi:BolA family transcriptional regulator, general stress-responsive regulator
VQWRLPKRKAAMAEKAALEQLIRERLAMLWPEALEVYDDSAAHAGHAGARESGGGHFEIMIVSSRFQGQNRLARHRAVYDALSDLIPARIHALTIRAYTPPELAAGGSKPLHSDKGSS